MEQINNSLDEERKAADQILQQYETTKQENDILKQQLQSMGNDMERIKGTMKTAFEEEEGTKNKIKEVITAMHTQLKEAQTKVLEKEEENIKLMEIIEAERSRKALRAPKTEPNFNKGPKEAFEYGYDEDDESLEKLDSVPYKSKSRHSMTSNIKSNGKNPSRPTSETDPFFSSRTQPKKKTGKGGKKGEKKPTKSDEKIPKNKKSPSAGEKERDYVQKPHPGVLKALDSISRTREAMARMEEDLSNREAKLQPKYPYSGARDRGISASGNIKKTHSVKSKPSGENKVSESQINKMSAVLCDFETKIREMKSQMKLLAQRE